MARNWRVRGGKIDLIVAKGDVLARVLRGQDGSGASFGEPFEAVTAAKQARIRRLAGAWLRSQDRRAGGWGELRFDVASVRGTTVEIIEAAF